jgi:hypothetical protein
MPSPHPGFLPVLPTAPGVPSGQHEQRYYLVGFHSRQPLRLSDPLGAALRSSSPLWMRSSP